MVAFSSLIAATAVVAGVSAAVAKGDSLHKRLTTSSTGTASDGFYYSFWTEESTGVDYEDGSDGKYSVTWESSSIDFVAGKGWATGSDRYVLVQDGIMTAHSTGHYSYYLQEHYLQC